MRREEFVSRVRRAVRQGGRRQPHPGSFTEPREYGDLVEVLRNALEQMPGEQALELVEDLEELHWLLRRKLRRLPAAAILWEGEPPGEPRDHAAGVASGVAVLAASGTVICDPGDPGQAQASLLCDHSFLMVPGDRLYGDLLAWSRTDAARQRSRYLVQITGTSRTADIEKTLVTPAHGPGRLTLILAPPGTPLPTRQEVMESTTRGSNENRRG